MSVCLVQGVACPELITVFVDLRALRNDRVTFMENDILCFVVSAKVGTGLILYYEESG